MGCVMTVVSELDSPGAKDDFLIESWRLFGFMVCLVSWFVWFMGAEMRDAGLFASRGLFGRERSRGDRVD